MNDIERLMYKETDFQPFLDKLDSMERTARDAASNGETIDFLRTAKLCRMLNEEWSRDIDPDINFLKNNP